MVIPEITVLYAGILGLMSIGLSSSAGLYRARAGIAFGDGGDLELAMRMRRHANFTEYAPLAIVLIALLEAQSVPQMAIHALGITLILGRSLHWIAFNQGVTSPVRGIGAGLTVLTIAISSVWGISTFFVS